MMTTLKLACAGREEGNYKKVVTVVVETEVTEYARLQESAAVSLDGAAAAAVLSVVEEALEAGAKEEEEDRMPFLTNR
jgi:hypothetical protein